MVDINPDTVLENQYRISIYNIEILRHIKTSDESQRRQRRQGSLAMFGRGARESTINVNTRAAHRKRGDTGEPRTALIENREPHA